MANYYFKVYFCDSIASVFIKSGECQYRHKLGFREDTSLNNIIRRFGIRGKRKSALRSKILKKFLTPEGRRDSYEFSYPVG